MADPATRVGDSMVTIPVTHDGTSTAAQLRRFFADDHVHLALVVDARGRLLTTVERADLAGVADGVPARRVGTLSGRTVGPAEPLASATARLRRAHRRRLAVVDHEGRLLGLLCLKRDGSGYCCDSGVRARADERHPPDR